MPTEVKICGLKTADMIDAAIEAGADYIGLVHYERSPRHVSVADARRLADHARRLGRARVVVLTVDADDDLIRAIAGEIAPHIIQLQGRETVERVTEVGRLSALPIFKAVGVATADDVAAATAYRLAGVELLFDAKPPTGHAAGLPGGNGLAFDWRALSGWTGGWFMLAGGLTPGNVADAVRLTGAPAVDVSSGVESAPGVKDASLIRAFIRAAKSVR